MDAKCGTGAAGLRFLPGVGPWTEARLREAGIPGGRELLLRLPRSLKVLRALPSPVEEALGSEVCCLGKSLGAVLRRLPGRRSLVVVRIGALLPRPEVPEALRGGKGAALLEAAFFNQPWMLQSCREGARLRIAGRLERKGEGFGLVGPRLLEEDLPAAADGTVLLPEYGGLPEGVGERRFRGWIRAALDRAGEWFREDLPPSFLEEHRLLPLPDALRVLHGARGREGLEAARRRVALLEALELLAGVRRRRALLKSLKAAPLEPGPEGMRRVEARLPHRPSEEQAAAIAEIRRDLARDRPMLRLLQGEVGSGKTLVAFDAALTCAAAGRKAAFLAPTALLALQHESRFREALEGSRLPILGLRSDGDRGRRREVLENLRRPGPAIVVGTHALFEEGVDVRDLGLLIIDEQQRFGVRQRARLFRSQGGLHPHVLIMTATPIPRTLAASLFGDLRLSEIREAPVARPRVRTLVLPEDRWPRVLRAIRGEVRRGGKVFLVCPRIGEGEEGVPDATATFAEVAAAVPAGLVHGRLPEARKEEILEDFAAGRIACLVGTTVLEVGLDVPDATWIVVRRADLLGLSTLHQLRGRVGRGGRRALCLLLGGSGLDRIRILERCRDGFRLAEEDLRLRGAGELAGTRQHGHRAFRALRPLKDLDLLRLAAREDLLHPFTDGG